MILTLKQFNEQICYKHFKMENIHKVINIVKSDVDS